MRAGIYGGIYGAGGGQRIGEMTKKSTRETSAADPNATAMFRCLKEIRPGEKRWGESWNES